MKLFALCVCVFKTVTLSTKTNVLSQMIIIIVIRFSTCFMEMKRHKTNIRGFPIGLNTYLLNKYNGQTIRKGFIIDNANNTIINA